MKNISGELSGKLVVVCFLVAVLGVPWAARGGEPSDQTAKLPLLVDVPWGARYPALEPFAAQDLTQAVFRLLPLDPAEHGCLESRPPERGEWRAFLRVTGGMDEGIVWVALQVKGEDVHLSAVIVRLEHDEELDERTLGNSFVMTRELLRRYARVRHVPDRILTAEGIHQLAEAVDYCRTAREPLVFPDTRTLSFSHEPAVELRLVGDRNIAYLFLRNWSSTRWRRIIDAVRDLLPEGWIPFPIRSDRLPFAKPPHQELAGSQER